MAGADEFEIIARLLRPLTNGEHGALNLEDDAAYIPARPGYDLVVTKDTIVEGVHFLESDPLDTVARKLLRVNLSDLAAKGAAPFGYLLSWAWPKGAGAAERELFVEGLRADQDAFGLSLLGGDSVATPGPMVFSASMFGWVESGGMVRRSGARPGDILQVSGPIGDGWLGLHAALGKLDGLGGANIERLVSGFRTPNPKVGIDLSNANAAADVSDGLIADAGHIADASGVGVSIDLDKLPLSAEGSRFVAAANDECGARLALATGGDDYEIVAAAPAVLDGFRPVGRVEEGQGVAALFRGQAVPVSRPGYRHGNET